MKKVLLIFAFALSYTLIGCSQNDLEKSFDKMEDAESYRMEVTMSNIPVLGSMTMVMKVDDDMIYSSDPFSGDAYAKVVDGEQYAYYYYNGQYILEDEPMDVSSEDIDTNILEGIDYDDFEETDDNEWTLIEDRIYLDDTETTYMEDVVITLNDNGYVANMTFSMLVENMKVDVEIEFSDFNNTVVELPTE